MSLWWHNHGLRLPNKISIDGIAQPTRMGNRAKSENKKPLWHSMIDVTSLVLPLVLQLTSSTMSSYLNVGGTRWISRHYCPGSSACLVFVH